MTSIRTPGQAGIKSEFVVTQEEKKGSESDTKIENHENNNDQKNKEAKVSTDYEPLKKKHKGQNKARPRTVPKVKDEFRICPTILRNEDCRFGDKCKFMHDTERYIQNKPADIGLECVNYRHKGKCRYGIECRYGAEHISVDYQNIVDEEKYALHQKHLHNDNSLKKDTMIALRKKQYEFPRSEQYMSTLQNNVNGSDVKDAVQKTIGAITDENCALRHNEKKKIDFKDKLYLAPLTTVGNLPFRRICKKLGADITCGEMAMTTNLLQGHQAEWALVKRHESEDIFGVQICGGFPDTMSKVTEMLNSECNIDFIDINMGCPIDLVFKKGLGSALMGRLNKLETIVKGMVEVSDVPITIKMRTGIYENKSIAHKVVPLIKEWGVDLMTLHGRSREQRYTKAADWQYIKECAQLADPVPFFGNGDILSYEDVEQQREVTGVNGVMIARGALIKPWLFTEIKENRHWDISSQERFDLLKDFTNYGLQHWGSDSKGVENTRRFLLEWLSFLHRYIPVGLLETVPQKINERPPAYFGRNDLETLFASRNSADWVKISEMLLGPVPENFNFLPKHKANSYS